MTPNTLTQLLSDLFQEFKLTKGYLTLRAKYKIYLGSCVYPIRDHRYIEGDWISTQSDLIVKELTELNISKTKFMALGTTLDGTSKIKVKDKTFPFPYDRPHYLFRVEPLNSHEQLTNLGKYFEYEP
jgi:hypothetical protein